MSLISREYNCFIVLFEKYKIGRKIQAVSKVIILCHWLTSAFPFLLRLASGSGFKKVGKETFHQKKVLVGFGNAVTTTARQVGPKLLVCGGWTPSWSSLASFWEGVGAGRREVAPWEVAPREVAPSEVSGSRWEETGA